MSDKAYRIVEVFGTVQGEGSRAGARSVFVRFAGCNAWDGRPKDRHRGKGACAAWCDTRFLGGTPMTAEQIEHAAAAAWAGGVGQRWIVLTGGEPLLQVDDALVDHLHDMGWELAVETNGSIDDPVLAKIDHVCVSPKLGMPLEVTNGTELKVVLPGGRDPLGSDGWTQEDLERFEELDFRFHYLQPQDPIDPNFVEVTHLHGPRDAARRDAYENNVNRVLGHVARRPVWRVCLQTHKLLGVR